MGETILYVNGKIYTLDDQNHVQSAMAVKKGKIILVGSDSEVLALKGADTPVVDLKGAVILPGLCDCHVHLLGAGAAGLLIDATGKTQEEILEAVRARAETTEKGKWILGFGWNQSAWKDTSFPTKEELDQVAPEHPVKLTRYCGNAFWCNSMALELAGLTSVAEGTGGKEFLLNDRGELAGTLVGEACRQIDQAIPEHDHDDLVTLVTTAEKLCFERGITTVMDKGAGGESALAQNCGRGMLDVLKELYGNGRLKLRIYEAIVGEDEFFDDCFRKGKLLSLYNDHLTVRGIKIWSDGAFGPRSAWISEDYLNREGHRGNRKYTDEELVALFRKADEKDLQIAVHSIGDESTSQILDCYEKAFADSLNQDRRFILDHVHVPKIADIQRMAKYHIVHSTQFIQLSSDMEAISSILPKDMLSRLYPWRAMLDQGVVVTNGSDVPVDPIEPFHALYVAVSRKSLEGHNRFEQEPYQTLSRLEALRSYTSSAAYSMFREDSYGSLEPGKYADFIVIDRDYFNCPVDEIKDIRVMRTVIDGHTVFAQDET